MTAPPGGPYGQDPYGSNPYGQDQYWGGQPQGGQPQPGQPQGGGYPYPPPDGAYPPANPYANPQGTDPYGHAGYPPQPYPPTGQQYVPGWGAGTYPGPGGPPPGGPSSKTPWLVLAGIAILGVIALVVILVVALGNGDSSPSPSQPATSSAAGPSSGPISSDQTATDCTDNVSGGAPPSGGTVSAGKLSFPASAAPGWLPYSDDQNPNLIGGVGLAAEVPGANQWMMQVEVAITNFVTSMDVAAQAAKLMQCVANGPGYIQSQPTLGPLKKSTTTVDGVKAARVDADITIGDTTRNVKGDSVVIIAVDTKPVTIFLGAIPIGDTASQAIINKVIAALKVSK